jgi:hypothetical protein
MFLVQERYVDPVDHIQIQAKIAKKIFSQFLLKQHVYHLHRIPV